MDFRTAVDTAEEYNYGNGKCDEEITESTGPSTVDRYALSGNAASETETILLLDDSTNDLSDTPADELIETSDAIADESITVESASEMSELLLNSGNTDGGSPGQFVTTAVSGDDSLVSTQSVTLRQLEDDCDSVGVVENATIGIHDTVEIWHADDGNDSVPLHSENELKDCAEGDSVGFTQEMAEDECYDMGLGQQMVKDKAAENQDTNEDYGDDVVGAVEQMVESGSVGTQNVEECQDDISGAEQPEVDDDLLMVQDSGDESQQPSYSQSPMSFVVQLNDESECSLQSLGPGESGPTTFGMAKKLRDLVRNDSGSFVGGSEYRVPGVYLNEDWTRGSQESQGIEPDLLMEVETGSVMSDVPSVQESSTTLYPSSTKAASSGARKSTGTAEDRNKSRIRKRLLVDSLAADSEDGFVLLLKMHMHCVISVCHI